MPSKNTVKTFVANSYYHVYNCGVEKRRIFEDEDDYEAFLRYLKLYLTPVDVLRKDEPLLRLYIINRNLSEELELLAFCLMSNHFHFLLHQKTKDAITKFMRSITTAYSMYFNRKYSRVGSLFQNIYKAVQVENDQSLLHLSRYIHQNPAARGVSPSDYPWSSYQNYISKRSYEWLETKTIFEYFNSSKSGSSYQNFVESNTQNFEQIAQLLLED